MAAPVRARILGYLYDLPRWRHGRRPGFGLFPLDFGDIAAVRLEVEVDGRRSVQWATREDG